MAYSLHWDLVPHSSHWVYDSLVLPGGRWKACLQDTKNITERTVHSQAQFLKAEWCRTFEVSFQVINLVATARPLQKIQAQASLHQLAEDLVLWFFCCLFFFFPVIWTITTLQVVTWIMEWWETFHVYQFFDEICVSDGPDCTLMPQARQLKIVLYFLSSGIMEICSEICVALSLDNPLKTASWNLRF